MAQALAAAQARAAEWGADRRKFILMGHSAGAHLVALLAASPELVTQAGAAPWLGTIALDSAAYDLVQIMAAPHYRFYDAAFGSDAAGWQANSPVLQLRQSGAPFLAVCSSQRPDQPCSQAGAFVAKARALGMPASLLPEDLSHADINRQLGQAGAYTEAVERFMAGLDDAVRKNLSGALK